jgi:tetratricopeptide (TPR) repeat protein
VKAVGLAAEHKLFDKGDAPLLRMSGTSPFKCYFVTLQFKLYICNLYMLTADKSKILYGLIGLLLGFIIGFIFTNQVNRRAGEEASRTVASTRPSTETQSVNTVKDSSTIKDQKLELTAEELRNVINKGDANPRDITLQRNIGRALYLYAGQTGNLELLADAARFLKRAYEADPQDHNTAVTLANVLFDMGQASDPSRFSEARVYYLKALELKPDDVNVRTDLGLTYYFGKPSDPQRAIKEYRKSLSIDPRHELTLQNLVAALINTGNREEAQKRIEELQGINPSNPTLPNLRAQLAQSKNQVEE